MSIEDDRRVSIIASILIMCVLLNFTVVVIWLIILELLT